MIDNDEDEDAYIKNVEEYHKYI